MTEVAAGGRRRVEPPHVACAPVGRASPTFRIRRVSVPSEVDLGAHTKNHGVVGLHARRVIAAPTGIDDILSVELEVQPAGRLPSVPDFKRHFVAAGVRTEGSRVHVRRADREADFVLGTPGERSGMPEAQGDLVILVRRPVIGNGRIEEGVPTYRTGTVNSQSLQDRLVDAEAAALIADILIGHTPDARDGADN